MKMGAVEELREGKPIFLFAFKEKVTTEEKDILTSKIKSLGGIPRLDDVLYVTDCTHVLVPPKTDNQWCPKILGAINSQKFIVTTEFIHKSYDAKHFLREIDFVPRFVRPSIELRKRSGKLFNNQTSIVLVDNMRRQAELKMFLREGGATVPNWTITDLRLKSYQETSKLQYIYTDMATYENQNLKKYISKRASNGNPVKVLSYFMICKIVTNPQTDATTRRAFESQFDVKNEELMNRLHPRKAFMHQVAGRILPVVTKREAKNIVEITIDSSDDEDDDDIQHIPQDVDDDEIEIVSVTKGGQKRTGVDCLPPVKKIKMESAFQYTYPKPKSVPNNIPKGEIITLDSSDDEQVVPPKPPATVLSVVPETQSNPDENKTLINETKEPFKSKNGTLPEVLSEESSQSSIEDDVPEIPTSVIKEPENSSSFMTFGAAAVEDTNSDWDVSLPAHNSEAEEQSTDVDKTNEDSEYDEEATGDEVEAEDEKQDIVKFTSADLTKELVRDYFYRYRKYQRNLLVGMDICDEFEKSSPKFDLHKESDFHHRKKKLNYDFKYFDENNNPYTKAIQEQTFEVIYPKDDDKAETMMNLYDKLIIYRSMISSRHDISVQVLSQVFTTILELSKKESSPRRLTSLVCHQFFDVVYAQLRLHPINGHKRREYYKEFLAPNVPEFVHNVFKRALKRDNQVDKAMLRFAAQILLKDIFQWRKHDKMHMKDKRKDPGMPLISTYKNNQDIKKLVENIKACEKHHRLDLQALLLQIFAVCSLFFSANDDIGNCSLNSNESVMQRVFAQTYFKNYLMHLENMNLKDVFVKTYLLRPSWLSTLVLVLLINKDRFAKETKTVCLDTEVEKLLVGLIGSSKVDKLCHTDNEFVLMFLNHLLQTTPLNLMSRAIMKDRNALVDEIKLKPLKLPIVDNKDKKAKKFPFDNDVTLDKKLLQSSLEQCIDLLNRVSLLSEFKLTNWHFL